MTICPKCQAYLGDINLPSVFPGHTCIPISETTNNWSKPGQSVKCDICGSTAIDHTENQCQINRQLKKF